MRNPEMRAEVPPSIRLVFALLAVVSTGAITLWSLESAGVLRSEVVDVWAPHVASGGLELLVAAAVLDRLVRRNDAAQMAPLERVGLDRLGYVLSRFVDAVVTQYAYIGPHNCEAPEDRETAISHWLASLSGAKQVWLPRTLTEIDGLSIALDELSYRYGQVLDGAIIAAIEDCVEVWNTVGIPLKISYDLTRAASPRFGAASPDERAITRAQFEIIERVVSTVKALIRNYELIAGESIRLGSDARERFQRARLGAEALAQP